MFLESSKPSKVVLQHLRLDALHGVQPTFADAVIKGLQIKTNVTITRVFTCKANVRGGDLPTNHHVLPPALSLPVFLAQQQPR